MSAARGQLWPGAAAYCNESEAGVRLITERGVQERSLNKECKSFSCEGVGMVKTEGLWDCGSLDLSDHVI